MDSVGKTTPSCAKEEEGSCGYIVDDNRVEPALTLGGRQTMMLPALLIELNFSVLVLERVRFLKEGGVYCGAEA